MSGNKSVLPLTLAACVFAGVPPAAAQSVRFVAFGDGGTGTAEQYAVGAAMAQVCATRGCDFALMLGDNFYPSGVISVDDTQWTEKFGKPYAALRVPVYAVLGNHDTGTHGGEGNNNARGNVQVRYHFRADPFTSLWRMPARFYSFTAPLHSNTALAEFFALDSSPLATLTPDPDPRWEAMAYAARQGDWLGRRMAASRAPWKIAFAHHPMFSNGVEQRSLPDVYHEFLRNGVCGRADLFFAGHDHQLQWLKPHAGCARTHLFVSGAAAAPRPLRADPPHDAFWQAGETLGFFWLRLHADRYTVAAYTLDGKHRASRAYELTVAKP